MAIVANTFQTYQAIGRREDLSNTIKWYKPDIMVIGSDWRDKEVIGEMFADKLVFFDRVGNYSTSQILHTYNKEVDWTLQTR